MGCSESKNPSVAGREALPFGLQSGGRDDGEDAEALIPKEMFLNASTYISGCNVSIA